MKYHLLTLGLLGCITTSYTAEENRAARNPKRKRSASLSRMDGEWYRKKVGRKRRRTRRRRSADCATAAPSQLKRRNADVAALAQARAREKGLQPARRYDAMAGAPLRNAICLEEKIRLAQPEDMDQST